ncbi:MAG: hypothetical protein V9E96_00025 [Chitinophagaceae bacterium]|jgi:hypothetical protein|nr:hypothetical protein [Chitinophagaceae bacterium]MBP9739188.1 hypothetical protein [Chitinophagaceae bacterium]
MKLTTSTLIIVCVMVAICLPSLVNAQPVFDDDVNDVPVDGGLSLLIAAGVGYGAKKMKQIRNNSLEIKD